MLRFVAEISERKRTKSSLPLDFKFRNKSSDDVKFVFFVHEDSVKNMIQVAMSFHCKVPCVVFSMSVEFDLCKKTIVFVSHHKVPDL